jgi:outer membrane protein TolC
MEKLMSDSLEMARSHLNQVQAKYNAGVVTKADLLKSKVREANAIVALTKTKYEIDLAKDRFNTVLGKDLQQPVNLKDEGFSGKVANLPQYDTLLHIAFDNRPDWKMYLLLTGISEDQVKLSRTDYLPSFVLNANAGNQISRFPTFQSDVNSWKIAGVGTWKLFDSFGRENRVSEAAENLAAQQANIEQVKNMIELEVHDAYLMLKSSLDVVVATQQAVESAQESYKVADSRYNAGLGTNIEVIDAQVDLTQAWTDHLNALFDVEIAKAKINKSVGKKLI